MKPGKPKIPSSALSRSSSSSRLDQLRNQSTWQTARSGASSMKSEAFSLNLRSSPCEVTFRDPLTITPDERRQRIQTILMEIEKEKPLCELPLHSMSFKPQSLIWSPVLSSFYGPQKKVAQVASPAPSSVKSQLQVSQKDFVRLNALTVNQVPIKLKAPRLKVETPSTAKSHQLGSVPKYLVERKHQWKEEAERKIREQPDPDCPPGHVLMPEGERLETLSQLEKSREEMIEEINSLPVSRDTLRIRQKRQDLEKQIAKIEEGIVILSKPKVFVKTDG